MAYYMSPMEFEIAEIATRKAHNDETITVSELREELISRGFSRSKKRNLFTNISSL